MIVSELKLYDFRKFHAENGEPGLSVCFHKGLNALIGENDSGKTAVIDALKLVLLTQSNDYVRPVEEDFYADADNKSVNEFRIECVLSEFTQNEAKNFIEFLEFSKDDAGLHYSMHLYYRAWKEKNRIFSDLRINNPDDGVALDSRARELLKAVYLRPLRDAEREMHSGRNSRLSQILMSHKVFLDQENHALLQILKNANQDIETYFTQQEGQEILQIIRDNLTAFHDRSMNGNASLTASDVQLKSILESLSLNAPEIHPGLGELNLVFIAAELLLLKQDDIGGLKLALIEELEAHLHPQAQLRLISYLQKEYDKSGAQIIISTHSTILASKINLKNIVLLKGGCGYDLSEGKTGLEKGDYLFLQRFLDTTKSNLFFAKGVIMVEGDAENLLIPIIAEIIGYPLEKHGVSIVNVGSTAFLRYSRIFIRGDQCHTINVPVAREALMDSYGFTDDSFKLFAKTISIKETGTWVITYMPIKYPEHIGKYVVELNAITGDIINCSWSYDLAPYKDLQPDTWESDIWTMEKTNRLLHFEATRMKILEEMEKEKGPFDEWTIQEKADFDADLLILGYPRNDCVVNILPQEDDINEQEALNKAEEIIRECLHEPSITIRPITVSFFLLEDNTKEWLIVTTTNEKPEETYTIEIASPSYEILSCTVPIENIEEPRNQNNPLYAYLEDEILNAAWNVMMTNYGFLDEVRPFFTATISNLDTMYEITFISNNYNPAKVGTYTIKLSKAGLATLSASWDLQHEYEQQGPQRPWKAAELWSSYEYNQYTTLQKKGKAIMSDAGSEVSWGMDFEHQAAYDTIYREAGYDRKQYYHALPSPIDLSKEGATTLAINAVTQKSPNLKNSLQSNDILYEFDVSEEDKPIWRISIPDLTNNSMFLVEIDSKNRNVIRITNSSLSN